MYYWWRSITFYSYRLLHVCPLFFSDRVLSLRRACLSMYIIITIPYGSVAVLLMMFGFSGPVFHHISQKNQTGSKVVFICINNAAVGPLLRLTSLCPFCQNWYSRMLLINRSLPPLFFTGKMSFSAPLYVSTFAWLWWAFEPEFCILRLYH